MASMKALGRIFVLPPLLLSFGASGEVPAGYKGQPFQDATHNAGPQTIPGRLQAALYDLGGEGVAYHDVDPVNHGSGELNHPPDHCEAGVPIAICRFRENEGWTEDGEWTNYTVDVQKPGNYRIVAMYSHIAQTITFSLNNQP